LHVPTVARERRLAFGEVADLYDRARPTYPDALVDDVIAVAPLDGPARALEVGAGTGKATVLFAARGAAIHALEPIAEMAAVARRNCVPYPDVTIEVSEFEAWRPPTEAEEFGLVYSAQAWHWISPETRYAKARAALARGGLLAVFWNRPAWDACALRDEIDAAYARTAPELLDDAPMRPRSSERPRQWARWPAEIGAAEGLEQAEVRTYTWQRRFSSHEYTELLRTHSDHIVLERARQEALYLAISDVIDAHGGFLELTYRARLCLARAV
jgi:SAM-dependent methyltransferase